MAMDIVEISSSPEPEPHGFSQSKKRRVSRPRQHALSAGDTVVFIDSDVNEQRADMAGPSCGSNRGKSNAKGKERAFEPQEARAVAGPSRVSGQATSIRAPIPRSFPAGSPPKIRHDGSLFFPSSDDKAPMVRAPSRMPKPRSLSQSLLPQPFPMADLVPTNVLPAKTPSQPVLNPFPPPIQHDVRPEDVLLPPSPHPSNGINLPDPDSNPLDTALAQVLEIVPDVLPTHAVELISNVVSQSFDNESQEFEVKMDVNGAVQRVLHQLFEEPSYPKVDKKGKRKRDEEEEGGSGSAHGKRPKIDYLAEGRVTPVGGHYGKLAMDHLVEDFPTIPKIYIRHTFTYLKNLYALTHLQLKREIDAGAITYKPKKAARPSSKAKGKGRQVEDEEFTGEREWLLEYIASGGEGLDGTSMGSGSAINVDPEESGGECEDGIECGCCFSKYRFEKMIQCPDAHLFCTSCCKSYAENLLGQHNISLVCMDQSGCKLAFPFSELKRFLTPKLMELYERVKQRKEIEDAGIEGLEECPMCEFKIVIENPEEKLFRCQNPECEVITCRKCKKSDHLPKSCEEADKDKTLNAQHHVEEAMTRALMRNCPTCQKAFIKETGCNKMSCTNCHTVSCYVCRKVVTGYGHFGQVPGSSRVINTNACPLWDEGNNVENRHTEEVSKAAKEAMEAYKRSHPEVDQDGIKIDMPKAPPVAAPPQAAAPRRPHIHHHVHHYEGLNAPIPYPAMMMRPARNALNLYRPELYIPPNLAQGNRDDGFVAQAEVHFHNQLNVLDERVEALRRMYAPPVPLAPPPPYQPPPGVPFYHPPPPAPARYQANEDIAAAAAAVTAPRRRGRAGQAARAAAPPPPVLPAPRRRALR